MDRARWLDTSATILVTLLDLLHPQERDAAFEELVAKVRTRRAKSRSAVLEPVRSATPARGQRQAIPREEPK